MARHLNETQEVDVAPFHIQVITGAIGTMLVLSLCWNFFCCVSKYFSGKELCKARTRQRQNPRQMEDNPIYGNIIYIQSRVDPQQSRVEREDEGNADPVSTMSDLYASVQYQRTKTVGTVDNEEGDVKRL